MDDPAPTDVYPTISWYFQAPDAPYLSCLSNDLLPIQSVLALSSSDGRPGSDQRKCNSLDGLGVSVVNVKREVVAFLTAARKI